MAGSRWQSRQDPAGIHEGEQKLGGQNLGGRSRQRSWREAKSRRPKSRRDPGGNPAKIPPGFTSGNGNPGGQNLSRTRRESRWDPAKIPPRSRQDPGGFFTRVTEEVQKASISMISLCIEHTALLAGREVKEGSVKPHSPSTTQPQQQSGDEKLQNLVLTYPGKYISGTKMNNLSKFRRDGGKQKVKIIFTALEHKQLGRVYHGRNNVSEKIKLKGPYQKVTIPTLLP